MEYTANYNLKKPEGTDPVLVGDINDNSDIIDAALGGKIDEPATEGTSGQVLSLDSNLNKVWSDPPGGAEVKNGTDLVIKESSASGDAPSAAGFVPYAAAYKVADTYKDDGNTYWLLTNSSQQKRIHTIASTASGRPKQPQSKVCDCISVGEYIILKTTEYPYSGIYYGTSATVTNGVVSWGGYAEYNKTIDVRQIDGFYYLKLKNDEWSGVTYNAMFMPYDWVFDSNKYGISDSIITGFSLNPSNINANFEIIAGDTVVGKGASTESNRYFGSSYAGTIDKLQDGDDYYKFADQRVPKTDNLADGNYKLRVSIASGVPTFSWVADT